MYSLWFFTHSEYKSKGEACFCVRPWCVNAGSLSIIFSIASIEKINSCCGCGYGRPATYTSYEAHSIIFSLREVDCDVS